MNERLPLFQKLEQLKSKENLSFEEAMALLEEVVKSLEQGKISLEQSVELYKQGTELVMACQKKLEEAEAEIKKYNVKTQQDEDFEA